MNVYFQKNHQRAFGTFPLKNDELLAAIECAAKVGYRAFDTAQMYENEATTGEGLAATGIDRADLCITTKVNIGHFTEDAFLPSVEQSLKDLRTDYVDVLLLHWPPADGDIAAGWNAKVAARRNLARAHAIISDSLPSSGWPHSLSRSSLSLSPCCCF